MEPAAAEPAGDPMTTADQSGFRQPAEWEPHQSCWLAWPSAVDLWQEQLPAAQAELVGLCRNIAVGEPVDLLVPNERREAEARAALGGMQVRFHRVPFGDIWLRDIAP